MMMKAIRILFFMMLCFCSVFSPAGEVLAARSYRISEEVSLPTGKGHVVLLPGSIVTVNQKGHVVKGTLSKDQFVNAARITMRFKAGTEIVLSDAGNVLKGTILANETIPNGRHFFRYMGGTEIILDENGYVLTGKLIANQLATTANGQKCLIKAGATVTFAGGFVKSCVLAQTQSFSNGVFVTGYLSDTEIFFNGGGLVTSGVLAENQIIHGKQYYKGDRIRFNKNGIPML